MGKTLMEYLRAIKKQLSNRFYKLSKFIFKLSAIVLIIGGVRRIIFGLINNSKPTDIIVYGLIVLIGLKELLEKDSEKNNEDEFQM